MTASSAAKALAASSDDVATKVLAGNFPVTTVIVRSRGATKSSIEPSPYSAAFFAR